jgi:hypothetical protein
MSTREQSSTNADAIGIGIALGATGIYFVLMGLGVLPVPGGEDSLHGPPAIVVAAGAAFLFAGVALAIRAKAGARDSDGDLPAEAPPWTHLAYRIAGIAVAGSLAAIGTWIAIGAGPRAFSVTAPFVDMRTTGQLVGRTMFGLGAVIVWIYVIALTVGTVRKIFDRRSS